MTPRLPLHLAPAIQMFRVTQKSPDLISGCACVVFTAFATGWRHQPQQGGV